MRKYWLILAIIALSVILVIVISYSSKPTAPKLTIKEQLTAVGVDLKTLDFTLGDYFSTHNAFPGDLISLSTPIAFISTLPVDPFNQDRQPVDKGENPYKYLKRGQGETVEVTLYSYGPDTDDDNASVVYDSQNGTISNGDIVRHMSAPPDELIMGVPGRWYLYENRQIARASDDNGIKDFMLALKNARYDLKNPKDSAAIDTATSVTRVGWLGKLSNLEMLLERNQPAFALIHEGAKKPFAKSVVIEKELDYKCPVPNFLSIQTLAKLMISQGKKFESEGKPTQAMQNYIAIAKIGQSVGNGTLMGKLIDTSIETMAYKALHAPLLNSQLDHAYLESLLKELEQLENSSPPLATAFWHEHLAFSRWIEHSASAMEFMKYSKSYGVRRQVPGVLYLLFAKNTIIKNSEQLWTDLVDNSKKPYPKAIMFDLMSRLKNTDPINKEMDRSYGASIMLLTRDAMRRSYARGVRIMAALELFKVRNKACPSTIDELGPILDPIPLDPFTEKNFKYEKVGDAYKLYSAGPDMLNDMATLLYDPTNGTCSPGDIIFRE